MEQTYWYCLGHLGPSSHPFVVVCGPRTMETSRRFSAVLLAVALSPAFMQTSVTCNDTGNAALTSLAFESGGLDRVVGFVPKTTRYDVWVDGATVVTVRATAADPSAAVRWRYGVDAGAFVSGGGEVTTPVHPGSSSFLIFVRAPGGATKMYELRVDPRCSIGECDDANSCTTDVCNAEGRCEFLDDTDHASCAFEGGPGICMGGACQQGRRWGAPARISEDAVSVDEVRIAMDPSGNALVVWRAFEAGGSDVRVNHFMPAEGWGEPELLSAVGAGQQPDVVFGPGGDAIAVWSQDTDIFSSWFTATEGWTPATRVHDGLPWLANVSNSQPRVALAPNGDAIAVWSVQAGTLSTDGHTWTSRFTPTEGWGVPRRLGPVARSTGYSAISLTPDGGALAVWLTSWFSVYPTLQSARFTPEDGWVDTGSFGTAEWRLPELVSNEAGEALLVFLGDYPFGYPFTRRFDPDNGWQADSQLLASKRAHYAASIDGDGSALVVRSDEISLGVFGILAARSTTDEDFGETVQISDTSIGDAYYPDVEMSLDGNAIAVFRQNDGHNDPDANLYFNRFTVAGGWETPGPAVHRDADVIVAPVVGMDPSGNAIVVWGEADEAGRETLWASHYGFPAGPDARGKAVVIDAGVRSFDPKVAVNDRGLALVVWDSEVGMTARFRYGPGDWGYPQIIQDDTGNAQFPDVGLDDDDRALVAWAQAPHAGAYYARYSPALGWEPPGPVDSVDSSFESYGTLSVAPTGDAVALWKVDGVIEGSVFSPGQGWSLAAQVSGVAPYDAGNPGVFLGPNGDGLAVWAVPPSSEWSRRYVPGLGFAEPELITDAVTGSDSTRVAVAPDGGAIAVWHRYWGGQGAIWYSHYEVGQGWTPVAELDQTDEPLLFDPQIGMDAEGNALVVWRQASGAFYDLWSRSYSVDTGWTDAELIELATGQSEDPVLAVNAAGQGVVTWALGRTAQPAFDLDIWANRYTPGEGWGVARQIEYTFRGVVRGPDVGIAGDGTAVVTWDDGQQVWARVLVP